MWEGRDQNVGDVVWKALRGDWMGKVKLEGKEGGQLRVRGSWRGEDREEEGWRRMENGEVQEGTGSSGV